MAKLIADLLLIGVITFVGYSILIGFERKQLANMVLIVSIMLGLSTIMEDVKPVIDKWNARINSLQDTADRISNLGQGGWMMPVKGTVTQPFEGPEHHGIDIAAPEGTPVVAANKGEVEEVRWDDIYGNMILINHGGGYESLYGHLSGIDVKVGYQVIAGRVIGSSGNTGNSTGPHLHFEIRKNGQAVNPMSYFNK